jgi:DNA invertase Pin-like site-specific DNA recombinase
MNVAIYSKDMENEQIADLRAWVISKGFTNIIEYRDITPPPRHAGDKELGRMLQDIKKSKLNFVFINSLEQSGLIGTSLTNLLLSLCIFTQYQVHLISREEPWTDLSPKEVAFAYMVYCQHLDSEAEILPKARYTRSRTKKQPTQG